MALIKSSIWISDRSLTVRDCSVVRAGAVVSDLHLLTNRTTFARHSESIRKMASESDLFIFNGDVFDFQWSRHGDSEASVREAISWIKSLVTQHSHCHFVFLLGNHDSIPDYVCALDKLSQSRKNLSWGEHHAQLGDRIFLHGDLYHAGGNPLMVDAYRHRRNQKLDRSPVLHGLYWGVTKAGVFRVLVKMVSKRSCARRIIAYLDKTMGDQASAVREIYFGHLHKPFSNFSYDRFVFHNTGAALFGMKLNIMRFEYEEAPLMIDLPGRAI